jgi:hypothetical protein
VQRPDRISEPTRNSPGTLEAPERVIRLPEAPEEALERRELGFPSSLLEDDGSRTWLLVTAVALALVVLCLLLALPGQGRAPTTAATIHPLPATAPGADLAIPVGKRLRSQTVNAANDQDVLAIARGGPAALAPLVGAPVTGDGVLVRENYDGSAFSVRSRNGAAMIVYVPYAGQTDIALSLTAQRRVVFDATLQPVPPDLASLVGAEAAAVAARTGDYLVAVPESIHPIRHLRRS